MRVAAEEKIKTLLTRAVSEVIIKDHLEAALKSGKKLRVKLGIDPTSPDIHFGHAVSLLKLRQFQELGHQAVLIIGDFTARIGDPTGRMEARKALSSQTIKSNLKNYLKQIGKIIDIGKTEICHNNEWFGEMGAQEFYNLTSSVTVQQVMKRDDFRKRIENNHDIAISEMMYPLFQGYDSVMVRADVELGGEDQKVNLLMGRRVQRAHGMPEQDVLTTWIIEGTDGSKKMSKSSNNYIGVAEKSDVMFGKIMSIPDSLILKYFEALTMVSDSEIEKIGLKLKSGENPKNIKMRLAGEIVRIYHGEKKAEKTALEFERVFSKKELPDKIATVILSGEARDILDLLSETLLVKSKSETRRLILENAVKLDCKIINDQKAKISIKEGAILQVGKKRFVKIKIK